jgi:hypothetical protein
LRLKGSIPPDVDLALSGAARDAPIVIRRKKTLKPREAKRVYRGKTKS